MIIVPISVSSGLLLLWWCSLPAVFGFTTARSTARPTSQLNYYYFMDPADSSSKKDPSLKNVDDLRRSLEDLIQAILPEPGVILQAPEPSCTSRRVRERELELLESLRESDVALDQLVQLWSNERDQAAANIFVQMQHKCSKGLVVEAGLLRKMTQDYDDWAEPHSRLAMLLVFQNKVDEAVEEAEKALSIKPWHFETLRLCAQIALIPGVDQKIQERAKQIGRFVLPSLDKAKSRKAWVRLAVTKAKEQMKQAEAELRPEFGSITSVLLTTATISKELVEMDEWQ